MIVTDEKLLAGSRCAQVFRKILRRYIQNKISQPAKKTPPADNTGPALPKLAATGLVKMPTITDRGLDFQGDRVREGFSAACSSR